MPTMCLLTSRWMTSLTRPLVRVALSTALVALPVGLGLASTASAFGQDQELEMTTVVGGLYNPCGVAIQPGTGTVFVSDSANHRIVRIQDGKAVDVIVDFPEDVYGKGPKYNIGPLGLLFLDEKTLVVGGGGLPDGEELLRVYQLDKADKPKKADEMAFSFKLAPDDETKGEGNFYALAYLEGAIYVTCNGDDTKGWVSRAKVEGTKVSGYERFLATKEAVNVDAPIGITTSPRGELVIGQGGEINVPGDSLLTFYDPKSKRMLLNLETGLNDIVALAYSPTGQLYALDFSWIDTAKGGLFRLDASNEGGKQAIKPTKILSLDKPTAMAFGPDGALYITLISGGKAAEETDGATKGTGKLVKLAPGL